MKYLLLLLFLIPLVPRAQHNEMAFKKIDIEIDGEKVFDVFSVVQDHLGYIWMRTNLGLIRYDGISGRRYSENPDRSSNIYFNIKVLFSDRQGDIWIGSQSGLGKYDPGCDCFYKLPSANDTIPLTYVQTIAEDRNNNLWIGTRKDGLFKYDRKKNIITRFSLQTSTALNFIGKRIDKLLVDHNNNLWIAINAATSQMSSGLIRYNLDSGETTSFFHDPANPNSLTDNRISTIYEDREGRILIGTYKCGLHIYNENTNRLKRIHFDPNHPNRLHASFTEESVSGDDPFVQIIYQDQNGGYWIGTTAMGINYFNIRENRYKNYKFNLVNPQLLWSIFEDRQGNIWIGGVMGGGLYRADIFYRKYTLNSDFKNVESAYQFPREPNFLWVKSRQNGLSKMNLKTGEITRYMPDKKKSTSIGHNWVRSVYQENKNTLWVGLGNGGVDGRGNGDGGIDRMDVKSGTFRHYRLTRKDDGVDGFSYTVYSIVEDREGILWLGTGTGGIFRSDRNKKAFSHFPLLKNKKPPGDVILNLMILDSHGGLWASDFIGSGTLYFYNYQNGTFSPFLRGFKITNVVIDERGWLILSTWNKGLLHLNPTDNSFTRYSKKDGLPSNRALDIVRGNNGLVWVSTRMGPAKFDSRTGKISSLHFPKGRYNFGIFKTTDGQIFLGANNGLLSFYPFQVKGNPHPPEIAISDILISGKKDSSVSPPFTQLNLTYNRNDLTFKFIGLHYSDPEKNSYRYKLNHWDDRWVNAGHERTARYTNLPPGSYRFQVQAANSDGVWSKSTRTVSILITPPWWKTWWAYTLFSFLALLAMIFIRKYELNRIHLKNKLELESFTSENLRELDHLKSRFFANISHEFRTPLTLILGQINNSLSYKPDIKIKKSLEIANRNAQRLLHLINQLLDLSKLESGNMKINSRRADIVLFIKNILYSFETLAREKDISLNCTCEYGGIEIEYEEDKLEKVFLNLLSNAFKFTPAGGKITIRVNCTKPSSTGDSEEARFVMVSVSDTGIGISEENLPYLFDRFYQVDNSSTREHPGTGLGLALSWELVELHGGRIEVESKREEGSTFTVYLPFKDGRILQTGSVKTKDSLSEAVPINHYFVHESMGTAANPPSIRNEKEKNIVLVVEDNEDVRNYIAGQLTEDFFVLEACDGREGLILAKNRIPDLVITDIMMPKVDGHQLTTELKQDEKTSHIPIIMLTARAASENKIKGLNTGADDYLIKPFDSGELFARVNNLILSRKKLREQFSSATIIKPSDVTPVSQDQHFLQKVLNAIDSHIPDEQFGVEKLAEMVNMSVSQINRKLGALIDQSGGKLIRSMRLQRAADLLICNSGTIAEICYQVGFNDQTSFTRAFKKQFGHSPSKYKEKNKAVSES